MKAGYGRIYEDETGENRHEYKEYESHISDQKRRDFLVECMMSNQGMPERILNVNVMPPWAIDAGMD